MTIIYVHGVKVRSPDHGSALAKPFRRWLGPKLMLNGVEAEYEPVYWGDLAARFRWELQSRPRTMLLGMGGAETFAGLGALREARQRSRLDEVPAAPTAGGPVLGRSSAPAPSTAPALSAIPRERRADLLADLYLATHPTTPGKDPIVDDPSLAAIADAAEAVALQWDAICARGGNEEARAAQLMKAVDDTLSGTGLIAMGGFADWMTKAGETLRRAVVWPADATGTVFAELRPTLHEFIAYFTGDVFIYLNQRGSAGAPGEIPKRLLAALKTGWARKKQTGEKLVVITHSMGGQLFYDAVSRFAPADPELADLRVDHWITCGSQVSFFAELRLLLDQPEVPAGTKLSRPANVDAWTNFYDLNDLVGFIMQPVFDGVTDKSYNTGYGLAFAHTGFLARPSFFRAMATLL
jgi:hypothetical protein